MRRLLAFVMIVFGAVYTAHAATNTGAFPNDGKMLEDWTYTNAANETNVGTDGGNVNATANYTWNEIALPAGKYLPQSTTIDGVTTCTPGNFCSGGTTVHYDNTQVQGITSCSTATGGLFTSSASGSTANTDCYRTCNIDNMGANGTIANIAHAATLTGNDYYGNGNDTCEPATCVTGYHVQAGVGVSLPNGYTELEYIESTGTQYIDTRVGPTKDVTTVVEAVAQGTGDRGIVFSFDQDYYGSYVGDNGTKFYCASIKENVANNSSLEKTNIETTFTGVSGDYYQQATINGQTGSPYNSKRNFNHFYLFKGASWSHEYSYWAGKIYSFKIYKDGTLVLGFIPAKRNSDDVVGMYDTVSGTFFTNAGTGTFVAGPDILATCEPNTYNITWFDTLAADVTANEAATATYGGNINTPVKIDPAVFQTTQKGKRFIGWTFQQQSNNP